MVDDWPTPSWHGDEVEQNLNKPWLNLNQYRAKTKFKTKPEGRYRFKITLLYWPWLQCRGVSTSWVPKRTLKFRIMRCASYWRVGCSNPPCAIIQQHKCSVTIYCFFMLWQWQEQEQYEGFCIKPPLPLVTHLNNQPFLALRKIINTTYM